MGLGMWPPKSHIEKVSTRACTHFLCTYKYAHVRINIHIYHMQSQNTRNILVE